MSNTHTIKLRPGRQGWDYYTPGSEVPVHTGLSCTEAFQRLRLRSYYDGQGKLTMEQPAELAELLQTQALAK